MSTYIPLCKNPSSPEERKKLIGEKVSSEESIANSEIEQIRSRVLDFLMFQKGYCKIDLQENVFFKIELPDASFDVSADIIININNKNFMTLKCVPNSPESWERQSIAFCRTVNPYQIPYAVVTDGKDVRLLDIFKRKVESGGLQIIPSKPEAEAVLNKIEFIPIPAGKLEKEKRILFAFEAINCSPSNAQSK